MRIAVTGATGFIGRHVMDALLRLGHQPLAVVRDSAVVPEWAGAEVVRMDLAAADASTFERLGRPDSLVHLAWGGLPSYRSLHHFETELPTSYRFLSALVREGLGSVVVAGTCFEYGMHCGALLEQDSDPVLPYAFAKHTLRRQLELMCERTPFALTWGRLFYLYGAGQASGSLLPQLQRAIAEGQVEFPMSGGEQLRDFIEVREASDHLARLAIGRANVGIVNICSGRPTSVRAFVENWLSVNGKSIRLALGRYPYPDYEPMAFWGSRQKLDSCLLSLGG